jgi:hypothetical protein
MGTRTKVDELFDSLPDAPAEGGSEADALFAATPDDAPAPELNQDWGDAKRTPASRGDDRGWFTKLIHPSSKFTLDAEGNAVSTEPQGALKTTAQQFSNGSMRGFFDEAAGKTYENVNAMRDMVGGVPLDEVESRREGNYLHGRDTARQDSLKQRDERPGLSAASSLAGAAAGTVATGGKNLGIDGMLTGLGNSDADLVNGGAGEWAKAGGQMAAGGLLGKYLGKAARAAPVKTGLAGTGLLGGAAAFGDEIGMSKADRLEALFGSMASGISTAGAVASKARNFVGDKYSKKAGAAMGEALEGRQADLGKAESKLQDLGDERGVRLNAKAKQMEAEIASRNVQGQAQDEAVAMKAAADNQAKLERANKEAQRLIREEARLVAQSKSGTAKLEAAKQKKLAALEAEMQSLQEAEVAAAASKEGRIGQGYQSDYQAEHIYDVPDEKLSAEAVSRRQLLKDKKADVANRRLTEPLPEDRAQAQFEADVKEIARKRADVQARMESAKNPPVQPEGMPEYALPGELVPEDRLKAIFEGVGLDHSKYDPRSYKQVPFLPRGDDEKTGAAGFVEYIGDRRASLSQPDEAFQMGGGYDPTKATAPRGTGASRAGVVDSAEKTAMDAKEAASMFKLQRGIDNQSKVVQGARAAATPGAVAESGKKTLQAGRDAQQINSIPDVVRALNPLAAPSGVLKDPAARFAHFSGLAEKFKTDKSLMHYVPMLEQAAVMSSAAAAMKLWEAISADPAVQDALSKAEQ